MKMSNKLDPHNNKRQSQWKKKTLLQLQKVKMRRNKEDSKTKKVKYLKMIPLQNQ
jgi:hypothetical protein